MSEARSVLQQVIMSLAVAERQLQFEHRDLHWGNILIKRTRQEYLEYLIDGRQFHVRTNGVQVTIIDFTLSRLTKGTHFKITLLFSTHKYRAFSY